MGVLDMIKGKRTDHFGINGAIEAVKALKHRLADEKAALTREEEKLRDAAIDGGEIDEMPLVRQQARVGAVERALEKALADAGSHLAGQVSKIQERIVVLESEQGDLLRARDEALIRSVASFIHATNGRLAEAPRKGSGGTIHVPAVSLERSEVEALMAEATAATAPAPSKEDQRLAAVREELHKLKILQRYSGRTGLETLVG